MYTKGATTYQLSTPICRFKKPLFLTEKLVKMQMGVNKPYMLTTNILLVTLFFKELCINYLVVTVTYEMGEGGCAIVDK